MKKISIHDNSVTSYSVDCRAKRITIHTEYYLPPNGRERETTDVVFSGVLGYYIQDSLEGILFDIEEVPYSRISAEHGRSISEARNYAWPFHECPKDPAAYIREKEAKVFRIQSSTMFDGFVVCEEMAIVPA